MPHRKDSPQPEEQADAHSTMTVNGNTPHDSASSLQISDLKSAKNAVAITGMGDCNSPTDFWELLYTQRDVQSKVPEDRFSAEAFYHPRMSRPGSIHLKGGYFINDAKSFDPTFFNIPAQEALSLDPKQRKVLEVSYEALESAGVPLSSIAGARIGCFVANFTFDYQTMAYRDVEFSSSSAYMQTGLGATLLSNRVSYIFNLTGPSVTIDSACSSSIYALQLAMQSLLDGSCDGALVVGANLLQSVDQFLPMAKLGVLSGTSRSHTFDISADGYARAEAVNAVYIKRVPDAVRDCDPIRAVIRGTALNASGKSPGGVTNPNPIGQEAVMRAAYERTGNIDFNMTGYFECHGTGTTVGDPLEMRAIGKIFADGRTKEVPLLVGSVKSNLGHGEAASGITSLIKCVLALEKGIIPGTMGVKTLSPDIDFKEGRLHVVTENTPWPASPNGRIASLNSFGYGGANGHVVLQDTESALRQLGYTVPSAAGRNGTLPAAVNGKSDKVASVDDILGAPQKGLGLRKAFILPFSAHDEATMRAIVTHMGNVADEHDLQDLTYTLSKRRSFFSQRSFCIIDKSAPLASQVQPDAITVGRARARKPSVAFVFTGQGAQWVQMGLELLESFPVALKIIRHLDSVLQTLDESDRPSWKLEDAIRDPAEAARINEVDHSQPLCTAVQLAILELYLKWNIKPSAVIGHSSGEIAAAYAANFISMDDAIKIAYYRGLHASRSQITGSMLAVGLGKEEALGYTSFYEGKVTVACINSPQSVTLSGDSEEITAIAADLTNAGVFNRLLKTGNKAYHSHHMTAAGPVYEDALQKTLDRSGPFYGAQGDVKWVSSVTSKPMTLQAKSSLPCAYWRENLESPVSFSSALENILTDSTLGIDYVVEIGPHSALRGPIVDICTELKKELPYSSALLRNKDSAVCALRAAGELFTLGYPVDLGAANSDAADTTDRKVLTTLPPYQWQYRETYWEESRWNVEFRSRKYPRHDVLGSMVPATNKLQPLWRNILRVQDLPWLEDHQAGGAIVFPTSGYLAMASEAVRQLYETDSVAAGGVPAAGFCVRDFTINSPLMILKDGKGTEVLTSLQKAPITNKKSSEGWYTFSIASCSKNGLWEEHCTGRARILREKGREIRRLPDANAPGFRRSAKAERWYAKFAQLGLEYGPSFRNLYDIRASLQTKHSSSKSHWQPRENVLDLESRYFMHPGVLDCCLHSGFLAGNGGDVIAMERVYLPLSAEEIVFHQPETTPESFIVNSSSKDVGFKAVEYNTEGYDEKSKLFISIKGLRCKALDNTSTEQDMAILRDRTPFLTQDWKPDVTVLKASQATALFPARSDATVQKLWEDANLLALLCMHKIVSTVDETRITEWHLKHLFSWMKARLAAVESTELPSAALLKQLTADEREAKCKTLFERMTSDFYEVKLLGDLYAHYEDVLVGNIGALDILWNDGNLSRAYEVGLRSRPAYDQLSRVVDLLGHKNPEMKVLEIGAGTGGATNIALSTLAGNGVFKRYAEYTFTDIAGALLESAKTRFAEHADVVYKVLDIEKGLLAQGFELNSYDVIIVANCFHATHSIDQTLESTRSLLKPGGVLVNMELTSDNYLTNMIWGVFDSWWSGAKHDGRTLTPLLTKESWFDALKRTGYQSEVIALDDFVDAGETTTVFVARAAESPATIPSIATVGMLYWTTAPAVLADLEAAMRAQGTETTPISLSEYIHMKEPPKDMIILLDMEKGAFLSKMNAEEFTALQRLVGNSQRLVWLTPGGICGEEEPEYGMIYGFSRTACRENTLFDFIVVGFPSTESTLTVSEKVMDAWTSSLAMKTPREREYGVKDAVTYISRLVSDDALNGEYVQARQVLPADTLYDAARPTLIDLPEPGRFDSISFIEDTEFGRALLPNEVEIEVHAAGISLKSLAVAMGNFDSNGLTWEIAGIVTRVGSETAFKVNDRVVSFCTNSRFHRYMPVADMLVHKLEPNEKFEEVASLPVSHLCAIHAIRELAHLQSGESILIQSAAGATGQACIQLAKSVGAEIFLTAGSDARREFLHQHYGVPKDHIFNSRDSLFVDGVLAKTGGNGVDVVIATSNGELLAESFHVLAHYGRFVELGRTDIHDHGRFDLANMKQNVSFHSFDLSLTTHEHPRYWGVVQRHLKTMMELLRNGTMSVVKPINKFHITQLADAYRSFLQRPDGGKVVVTFEQIEPAKPIKVKRRVQKALLDPSASYLMIGCLGGLGRSLSMLMVDRGARSLVFLSRSGEAKPEARELCDDLRSVGVQVTVVKGDVANRADVDAALAASPTPIKGVVQAAMVLKDLLLGNMTHDAWETCVNPKVRGTLNLDQAFSAANKSTHKLDFFIMLSSISGYLGQTTQSNYAAANAFLDSLGRQRRARGLPGTSLALGLNGEVGHVSELDEAGAFAIRYGGTTSSEEDFLEAFEQALLPELAPSASSSSSSLPKFEDVLTRGYIISGLEPARAINSSLPMEERMSSDPRSACLLAAAHNLRSRSSSSKANTSEEAGTSLRTVVGTDEGLPVLLIAIKSQLSKLLLMHVEDMNDAQAIGEYGLDSMTGAEFRNWVFGELGVKIGVLELLEPGLTPSLLAEKVTAKFVALTA